MKKKSVYINVSRFLPIVSILLVAAAVRIWGIGFGLPYFFHFDESTTTYTAFYSANNFLRPDIFIHPMLLPYIMIMLFGAYYVFGFLIGKWDTTFEFFSSYVADPTVFLLLGRFFIASVGVVSLWLVYWVGKRLYGQRIGLVAAFFLSVSFLHVQESHYIKEDVLIGFLAILAFYFTVLIVKNGKLRNYVIMGILLGLLGSLKYNFFILIPSIFLAQFFRKRTLSLSKFFDQKFLLFLLSAATVFFLLNPYLLLEWREALPEIISQGEMTTTQWVSSGGQPVWLYYLTYHLRFGMSEPLLLLSLGGAVYLLVRRRAEDILLVATPLTFFVTLAVFGGANFARYAVIILPHLTLIAGIMVVTFLGSLKLRSGWTLALVSVVIMMPTLLRIIKFDYYLNAPDTRIIAKQWIEENIPEGTKVVNEGAARSEYRSIYGPPLALDKLSLERILHNAREKNQQGLFLQALLAANKNEVGYDLLGTIKIDVQFDEERVLHMPLAGVDTYVSEDYCYLISSNWAKGNRETYDRAFLESLEKHYQLIKEFVPHPIFAEDPFAWRVEFEDLDKVRVFSSQIVSGPTIKIYKLKTDKGSCE
ncbi:glycosyltransferase family 39 protein [Candidatus Microgenomates bacterium]|nr:glycosyltransferase family 39 protein [Candidatus Microgenomates bacterium]